MNKILLILFAVIESVLMSCKEQKTISGISFVSPISGGTFKSGEDVQVKLAIEPGRKVDSIIYLIDTSILEKRSDTLSVKLATSKLRLGSHLITSQVYSDGNAEDINTNINVLPAKAPELYSYEVIKSFPHDTSSYVEGLEFKDGIFYESDGEYGRSSLRKVNPETGKVIKQVDLPEKYFGEGITVLGDKIIQITYREKMGFVYDKTTLEKLSEFPYQAGLEGWGLSFDGKRILNTVGTNTIYYLNKDTYQSEGYLEVYDDKGPVQSLNELEYIDGKIYANIYLTNKIVIIDPETGAVEAEVMVDAAQLMPNIDTTNSDYVLNGIAWDEAGKRLFITGKKWDKLFQIKIVKR